MSENWECAGMGVALIVSVSTFTFICFSFSLTETPNFCSSSTMSSPRSLNFTVLPISLCVPQYIDFAGLEIGGVSASPLWAFWRGKSTRTSRFLRRSEKVWVMLEGKDGWDKHGGLFSVGRCLEGGAYGYLCLAESTSPQISLSTSGAARFHVGLHGLGRLELVRVSS